MFFSINKIIFLPRNVSDKTKSAFNTVRFLIKNIGTAYAKSLLKNFPPTAMPDGSS